MRARAALDVDPARLTMAPRPRSPLHSDPSMKLKNVVVASCALASVGDLARAQVVNPADKAAAHSKQGQGEAEEDADGNLPSYAAPAIQVEGTRLSPLREEER